MTHYAGLLAGYACALAGFAVFIRAFPTLWPNRVESAFERPWLEVAFALCASALVLIIGQAYVRHWLLPKGHGVDVATESINQLLIFVPMLVLPFARKQSPHTVWLPTEFVWARIGIGMILAQAAILAYLAGCGELSTWWAALMQTYHPKNIPICIQVFLEDFSLAVLFVRLRAAAGRKTVIALVACVFALGHVPAMITEGASVTELAHLLLDAGLAAGALIVLYRAGDIWWFWCVHFAMDMMQFHANSS